MDTINQMINKQDRLPYEESAHVETVTGWVCKKCRRFYGDNEHLARWCCSTDQPCACGGRKTKPYSVCMECRLKKRFLNWWGREPVEWDGGFPISIWDDDRYFWSEEEVQEYVSELRANGEDPFDVWWTTCVPDMGRPFDVVDHLCDSLAEDSDLDSLPSANELNNHVNAWITAHGPYSWQATGQRISQESLKSLLESEQFGGVG